MPRGGARPGGGRPKQDVTRGQHQIRAYDDEWLIIQRFCKLVKHGDKEACIKALEKLESK